MSSGTVARNVKLLQNLFTFSKGYQIILISQWNLKNKFLLHSFRSNPCLDFFNIQTIVDKINVTLLQSPISPHSMLINEWLRQQVAKFSTKAPTTTNLQHWIGGKGGNGNIKSKFFGVTVGFVQDCSSSKWNFLILDVELETRRKTFYFANLS